MMNFPMTTNDFIRIYNPPKRLRKFASQFETMAEVWDSCHHSDWLFWILKMHASLQPLQSVRLAMSFAESCAAISQDIRRWGCTPRIPTVKTWLMEPSNLDSMKEIWKVARATAGDEIFESTINSGAEFAASRAAAATVYASCATLDSMPITAQDEAAWKAWKASPSAKFQTSGHSADESEKLVEMHERWLAKAVKWELPPAARAVEAARFAAVARWAARVEDRAKALATKEACHALCQLVKDEIRAIEVLARLKDDALSAEEKALTWFKAKIKATEEVKSAKFLEALPKIWTAALAVVKSWYWHRTEEAIEKEVAIAAAKIEISAADIASEDLENCRILRRIVPNPFDATNPTIETS